MSTIEVTIDLPFYLRVENALTVPYEKVCRETQMPELVGQNLEITFSQRNAGQINKMSWPKVQYVRTTVGIKAATPSDLSEESVNTFAIRNCLEIVNQIITSYQATTREVSNAGFIQPLGTSDMQLFAEIRVNGKDIRDRWPGHNINTLPLSADQTEEFRRYLTGQGDLPLDRLFLTNAVLFLERGQYPMAVLQAATAVELRLTQVVRKNLVARGWPAEAIEPYEGLTLGQKLRLPRKDPRSLKFHVGSDPDFSKLYNQLDKELTKLRNRVVHRGHMASHKEAISAVNMAREFLKIVS